MTSRFLIYALVDPRYQTVRYIGLSSVGLQRPAAHRCPSLLRGSNLHKVRWVKQLKSIGLTYEVVVLERCSSAKALFESERWWIASARRCGWRLVNLTNGGEGTLGFFPSAKTRAKLSAAHRGISVTAEARAKISRAQRRTWADPICRERRRVALLGHVVSQETREKISAGCRKAWSDPVLKARFGELQRKVWSDPKLLAKHRKVHKAMQARVRAAMRGRR